jgi:hypothetical protein
MTDRPEVESGRAGKMGATRKLRRWKDEMWGILSPTRLLARMDYVGWKAVPFRPTPHQRYGIT